MVALIVEPAGAYDTKVQVDAGIRVGDNRDHDGYDVR
jgi:hypothetical protein